MGENGAGKSTVMKIITGIYQPDSGEMSFQGKRLSPRSYRESLAIGIDIVHQEIQVVPDASIAENIMLDKLSLVSSGRRVNWRRLYEEGVGVHAGSWTTPPSVNGCPTVERGSQATDPNCASTGGSGYGDPAR